jgi:hypothetical protein
MACSFRHREEFVPSISSIKVLEKKTGPGYRILLLEETGGQGIACSGCAEAAVPLCVQYCRKSEELREILDTFASRNEAHSNDSKTMQAARVSEHER